MDSDGFAQKEFEDFVRRESNRGKSKSKTCPTCKRENVLTNYEAARGYQCYDCTRRDEGAF